MDSYIDIADAAARLTRQRKTALRSPHYIDPGDIDEAYQGFDRGENDDLTRDIHHQRDISAKGLTYELAIRERCPPEPNMSQG